MSSDYAYDPEDLGNRVKPLPGVRSRVRQAGHVHSQQRSRGRPEGRYVAGYGKTLYRRFIDQASRLAEATVRLAKAGLALEQAEDANAEHRERHRGGERSWLLRAAIPPAVVAEVATAFVAMEAIVPSFSVAVWLAVLAALTGAGLACMLANRRLNHLPVPRTARILEVIFVLTLTVLRLASLQIQAVGLPTAVGGAALTALISALALLGIEEIVLETYSFMLFVSSLKVSWMRRRFSTAATRLAGTRAAIDVASRRLEQHFLEFMLKSEGLARDEARRRAAALRTALTSRDA
jgi:hypothetical protein